MKNRNTKEQKQAVKENDENKGRSDKEKQPATTRPWKQTKYLAEKNLKKKTVNDMRMVNKKKAKIGSVRDLNPGPLAP